MNVAFDPWIPVVTTSGKPKLASIETVLCTGEQFADLAVRPHERVALMRLFLCVTHAALDGPKDYDEWLKVPEKLPDAVNKYLTEWKDSFELFHPKKPWLQVAGLTGIKKKGGDSGKTSPVALLDFELSTGNSSTLNDHSGLMKYRPIPAEKTALNLLTFQNFSPGGGSPIAQWETTKTSQVGNPDAPCISQSMSHCLFRGRNLLETIHLNVPPFDTIERTYLTFIENKKSIRFSEIYLGKPVWEYFPESPAAKSDRVTNATHTYIGRLVPVSRWIRLVENSDQMYCCNGFKYETYKDGFAAEPTSSVTLITKKDKKGTKLTERRVVSIAPDKAIWRELSALLIQRTAFGIGGPLAMENSPYETEFDFHVCAMTRDQASMDIALESVFHVTPALQTYLPNYQAEVVGSASFIGAEGYARRLSWALEDYRQLIDNDWEQRIRKDYSLKKRLAQTASLSYWTAVENNLQLLMSHIEAIGTDDAIPTRKKWRSMLYKSACDAYRVACGQETPRQMRAFAKGWQKLTATKNRSETHTDNHKEERHELAS